MPRVGITGASAGRPAPGSMPNAACAASTVAPVLPALKSAPARPDATSSAATRIEASGFRRSAAAGASDISTTSGASTISIPSAGQSPWAASRRSSTPRRPTSARRTSRWRAAATAPSTILDGAWSPPMASMAIVIMPEFDFVRSLRVLRLLRVI